VQSKILSHVGGIISGGTSPRLLPSTLYVPLQVSKYNDRSESYLLNVKVTSLEYVEALSHMVLCLQPSRACNWAVELSAANLVTTFYTGANGLTKLGR
jgi:hypothetical protein